MNPDDELTPLLQEIDLLESECASHPGMQLADWETSNHRAAVALALLKGQLESKKIEATALLEQMSKLQLIDCVWNHLQAREQAAVAEARETSNDWRTTARKLGHADGIEEAKDYLTGIWNLLDGLKTK